MTNDELSRLHKVEQTLERCKSVFFDNYRVWNAETEQLQTQRDELLEALKLALHKNENNMAMTSEDFRKCRAAITKAENWKWAALG